MTTTLRNGLAVLGASSIAVTIPLFFTLAQGLSFFLAHDANSAELLLFALLIYLGPPLLFCGVACIVYAASPSAGRWIVSMIIALCAGLWALATVRSMPNSIAIILGLAGALALTLLYIKSALVASMLRTIGWFSPLALIVFLLLSPVSKLLLERAGSKAVSALDVAEVRSNPVVFVVLDELSLSSMLNSSGELDAQRLPSFHRLGGISNWYRNAITVSSMTHTAVPALLSGLYPSKNRSPVHQDYPQNVFTALADSHAMNVTETVTRLCPTSVCSARLGGKESVSAKNVAEPDSKASGSTPAVSVSLQKMRGMLEDTVVVYLHLVAPQQWADEYLPSLSDGWSGFSTQKNERSDADGAEGSHRKLWNLEDMSAHSEIAFAEFSNRLSNIKHNQFHYFHVSLPHHPWLRLPDGRRYNGLTELGRKGAAYAWADNPYLIEQAELRYLMQLKYTDALLGDLLSALQESPYFDETLLVVVADHGLAFEAGASVRKPTQKTLPHIARIPMFIKFPHQQSAVVDDKPAQTIDLLPTIAHALNVTLGKPVDGRALQVPGLSVQNRTLIEYSKGDGEADFESALGSINSLACCAPSDNAQGPLQSYLLHPLEELTIESASEGLKAVPDNLLWYENVSVEDQFLPLRFTARVDGLDGDHNAMVSLNGRIAGSGQTHANGQRLSILLSAELFVQGVNRVELIVEKGSALHRVPLQAELRSLVLERKGNSVALTNIAYDGRRFELGQNSERQGWAKYNPDGSGSISGWAYDFQSNRAASLLLLLREDKLVSANARQFSLIPFGGDYEDFALTEEPGYSFEINDDASKYTVLALFDDGRFLELAPQSPP